MLVPIALALSLAPSAGEVPVAEGPVSVLVLDLKAAGIEQAQASVLNDIVGQSTSRHAKLKVITADDVRRMTDVEATKQLIGCDDASCLAQLAGDFGARYVLYGLVAALGDLYVIQLTLFDGEQAEAVERTRVETRQLSDMTHQIDESVDEVFASILGSKVEPPGEPIPAAVWITTSGVALTIAGVVLAGFSAGPAGSYADLQTSIEQEQRSFDDGDGGALARAAELHDQAGAEATNHVLLLSGGLLLTAAGIGVTTLGVMQWMGTE